MSRLRQMLKQSSVYAVLNILGRSISFILLPVYTRYLLPAEYGTLELVEITAEVFGMCASAGIGSSVFKFYHECTSDSEKNRVVSSGILGSTVFYSAFGLSGIIGAKYFSLLIFWSPEYSIYFVLVFIRFFMGGATTIITDYLRLTGRAIFYSTALLSQIILSAGLNVYFLVFMKMGVLGMVLGSVIGSFVVGIVLVFWIFRQVGFHFHFEVLRPMLGYGLPLIMSSLGHFTINFANRYFLQSNASSADVGIFSLGYRFGFLINFLIVSPFIMMWQGGMFEVAKKSNAKNVFEKTFTYLFLLIILGATMMSLFSREIVAIMADQAYHRASHVVPWIAFAFALNGCQTYFQLGTLLNNKTKYLGFSTLGLGLFSLPLFYIFTQRWGQHGAAVAITIVYLLFAVVNYGLSQRFYPICLEAKRLLNIIVLTLVLLTASNLIVIKSVPLSILVKAIFVLFFPIALWCTGFFTKDERQQLTQLIRPGFTPS